MKIFASAFILLCATVAVAAQQPTPSPVKMPARQQCCRQRLPTRIPKLPAAQAPQAPPDFFVGDAKVDVTKDETVVRLAMAQHGSVLIELPANDGPRYIIPGDPEMATVDEKALERNKRAIVVRPGTLFVPPLPNHKARTPTATVTAQMRSGLVVTFLFYPVEDLAQNVHRCVLTYNRDEVVARRRAAGLPVNLDTSQSQERRIDTGQSTAAPTSISVESDETKATEESSSKTTATTNIAPPPKDKESNTSTVSTDVPLSNPETTAVTEVIRTATQTALDHAIKKPKQFKKWTKPVHGLTLAVLEQNDAKENFRIAVVAVRNVGSDVVKITPGSPDLSLEMLDDQGKAVNVQSVKRIHIETNELSGAIGPRATIYYAIAYTAPVLGVHQQLKVAVSQTAAADEPALLTLATVR